MKKVLREVLLFSFFSLLIVGSFSSFTSLLNYIHKAHGQSHIWHAQIFFAINAVSAIFFNIVIPNLKITDIKKLTYAIPASFLMIYLFTYIGFVTENSTFTLFFTILAGLSAGIGNAAIAIVSGKYLSLLCEVNSAKQEEGRYFGIYGSIMACNFFIGALLSATALSYLSQKHDLYLILTILATIGIVYCKFLIKNPEKPIQAILEDTTTSRQTNKEQLDNITLIQENKKRQQWIQLNIKFTKTCIFSNIAVFKKMATLIPFQALNGLTVGYISHCLQDLVFSPNSETKDTFLTVTLMFVGIGGSFGAYTAGYLSDRFSSKKVFYVGVMVCLVSFFLGMITLNFKNELLSLLTSFMSGVGMMYTNSMLVVMCSKYYEGSMMVFGTNRIVINLALLIYSLAINVISPQNMHSQMFFQLCLFIIISLGCLYMVRFIRDKKYEKSLDQIRNETKMEQLNEISIKPEKETLQEEGL